MLAIHHDGGIQGQIVQTLPLGQQLPQRQVTGPRDVAAAPFSIFPDIQKHGIWGTVLRIIRSNALNVTTLADCIMSIIQNNGRCIPRTHGARGGFGECQ